MHHRHTPSHRISLGIVLAALVAAAFAAPAEARTGYPKVLNFYLSNDLTPEKVQALAQWDALVLDVDFPWENPGVIEQMRSMNPDIKILAYIPGNGGGSSANLRPPETIAHKFWQGAEDGDFWLYDVTGSRVGDWPGKWNTNLTPNSPTNAQGEQFHRWFARFLDEEVWQGGSGPWDGICLDNIWDEISWLNAILASPVDSDRNGVADPAAQLDTWWKATNAQLIQEIRNRLGSEVPIIANGANSIFANLNGTMLENFPYNGPSDQNNPYGYSWNKWMFTYYGSYYNGLALYDRDPFQMMIVNTHWPVGTPAAPDRSGRFEPHKRFTLGSALLGDGYYSLDFSWDDHAAIWWEPEFDRYLGDPLGPAYSYPLDGRTIWRRDYESATVVVNPNNQAVTPQFGIPAIGGWDAFIGDRIFEPPPQDTIPPAEIKTYWGWPNSATSATLKFWSVGDDGMSGRADHYLVRYSTERLSSLAAWNAATPAPCTLVPKWPGVPETLVVNGLQPETTYYFAAQAVDDEGQAGPIGNVYFRIITLAEDPPEGDITPPSAITSMQVKSVTYESVQVQWAAPGDDGNLGVASLYHGRYATFPITDANWNTATPIPNLGPPAGSGSAESATLTGLAAATTYYITMKAEDDAGNLSPLGNVVAAVTSPMPDLEGPEAVTDLTVLDTGAGWVRLGFTAPADAMNPVISYQFRWRAGDAFPDSAWDGASTLPAPLAQPPGTWIDRTFTGLPADQTISVRMRSADLEFHYSDLSNVIVAVTSDPPPPDPDTDPPAAIADLRVESADTTSVRLAFTAPGDVGGGTVAAYEVRRVLGGAFLDSQWAGAAVIPAPAPAPAGATIQVTATGLAPGTLYSFRARARDDSGNEAALSNTASAATEIPPPPVDTIGPDAVDDLVVVTADTTTITVRFSTPADPGGVVASLDLRMLAAASFPAEQWGAAVSVANPAPGAEGTVHTLVVSGLTPATAYAFRVRGTDGSGNAGALSAALIAATAAPPPPPDTAGPAAIGDLAVVAVGSNWIDLGFTAPADAQGTVVEYDLRRILGTEFSDSAWGGAYRENAGTPADPGELQILRISGLYHESNFTFRIRSFDDSGNASALSNPATGRTTELPPPPPDTQPPHAVSGLTANAEEGGVRLGWRAPPDADLSHYRVYRSRSPGGPMTPLRDQVMDAGHLDTQVVPGRSYCYEVVAIDMSGNQSPRSLRVSVDVPGVLRVMLPAGSFELGLPAPNPSNGPVAVPLLVAEPVPVTLDVYDVMGRLVRREMRMDAAPGETELRWDGRDDGGRTVGRGIYWIRVRTQSAEAIRRVLITP